MKYSVFTVSTPEYSPKEIVPILKELGYDGVDFRVFKRITDEKVLSEKPSFWGNNKCQINLEAIDSELREIKLLSEKEGIEISGLSSYLSCDGDIGEIESVLRAAAEIDCKRVRINTPWYDKEKSYASQFEKGIEGYKRVEALSKKYGVKALFEMHMNNITPSASAAEKFARSFDPKYVGVIYDIGNMVSEGYEIYSWGLEVLGEYLDYVHVKNACKVRDGEYEDGSLKWKTDHSPFNEGIADFNALYSALKSIGYDDYIVTEDFSGSLDTLEKLKFNIGYLKNIEKNTK